MSGPLKAMVFAAGIGSRLGEFTRTRPKCLAAAGGKPLLQHVLEHLREAGVGSVMINVHHFADQVQEFVRAGGGFGLDVHFSLEPELLETGGGLRNVEEFFRRERHFMVHNSDVFTDARLGRLLDAHEQGGNLATLALLDRPTSRHLVVDDRSLLIGWDNTEKGLGEIFFADRPGHALAFGCVHVVSPRIFDFMRDEPDKAFSIMRPYMKAARAGERIVGCRIDPCYWIDIGSPRKLADLRSRLGG